MELILAFGVLFSLLTISLFHYLFFKTNKPKLPPGKTGWPVIGESLEFIANLQKGDSEKFVFKRMAKYSADVFKTSLFGDHVAILPGAAGSKFLFANGNKLVKRWAPKHVCTILGSENLEATFDQLMKPALLSFVKADGLKHFVGVMDTMAQAHLESHWHGQVTVYPLAKRYAFGLVCRLFLSIENPIIVEKLFHPLETLVGGINSLPINLPGTQMNRACKASVSVRLQMKQIVKQQRLLDTSSSFDNNYHNNLLSHFLQACEDDDDVACGILGMLVAGHETVTSIICLMFKVLTDYPHIYHRVYQENMEVTAKKARGELLKWEDSQKLRYTWNVAREVMRIYPPSPFIAREVMVHFTYLGYHIPKDFTLMTSIHATHKDPKYFPEPEKFNPSRFDGDGPLPYTYIPFGGGPNMCPGMNYAQLAILVFMHNVVIRFKWETIIPNEEIIGLPFPKLAKGLPILLNPHTH